MKSRIRIDVTAEDIEKAHVGDSYKCVVAQAIARQVPGSHHIEVDTQTIRWSDEEGRHVFLTPYTAVGYVVAFDAGEELFPFKFTVRDPVPTAQRQARSEPAKTVKRSRDKIRAKRRSVERAKTVLDDPDASPHEVAAARELVESGPDEIAAALAAHEDVKAAYKAAGESIAEKRITETTKEPVQRVYKTKKRAYGHRVLRVNQAEGRKHYA